MSIVTIQQNRWGIENWKERFVDDLVLEEVDMKFLKMIDNTSHHIAHYQTTFYNQ